MFQPAGIHRTCMQSNWAMWPHKLTTSQNIHALCIHTAAVQCTVTTLHAIAVSIASLQHVQHVTRCAPQTLLAGYCQTQPPVGCCCLSWAPAHGGDTAAQACNYQATSRQHPAQCMMAEKSAHIEQEYAPSLYCVTVPQRTGTMLNLAICHRITSSHVRCCDPATLSCLRAAAGLQR